MVHISVHVMRIMAAMTAARSQSPVPQLLAKFTYLLLGEFSYLFLNSILITIC